MYIKTKDYIIEYRGEYENAGLCTGWDITLIEFPENPFIAEYREEGESKGEIILCYNSKYDEDEDFIDYKNLLERKIKNAITFLNANLI